MAAAKIKKGDSVVVKTGKLQGQTGTLISLEGSGSAQFAVVKLSSGYEALKFAEIELAK